MSLSDDAVSSDIFVAPTLDNLRVGTKTGAYRFDVESVTRRYHPVGYPELITDMVRRQAKAMRKREVNAAMLIFGVHT